MEFNNCTFNLNSDGFGYVQCMGGNVLFDECTFSLAGSNNMNFSSYTKFGQLNLYSDRYNTVVTLRGCNSVAVNDYEIRGGVGTVIYE